MALPNSAELSACAVYPGVSRSGYGFDYIWISTESIHGRDRGEENNGADPG